MGNQAASRFGQDGPNRITVVPSMLTEASEVMPFEPMYYPVVPFYPSSIISGGSITSGSAAAVLAASNEDDDWKSYPDKLDLFWWQGDDVQIQLMFQGDVDMSHWTWEADVRYWPTYQSKLAFTFVVDAQFVPEVQDVFGKVTTPAHTTVTLFLPREVNARAGKGSWELHSISPYDGPLFDDPAPDGVSDEMWPPTTQLKTWMYGNVTVVPRTNNTDVLPPQPVPAVPAPTVIISSYGPNGRVP